MASLTLLFCSDTDSDIDSGSFAAPQRVRTKKRRRHTLSDVQRAMMQVCVL